MCEVQLKCSIRDCENAIEKCENDNNARIRQKRFAQVAIFLGAVKSIIILFYGVTGLELIYPEDYGIAITLLMGGGLSYFLSRKEIQIPIQTVLAGKVSRANRITLEKINVVPYYKIGFMNGNETEKLDMDSFKKIKGMEENKITINIDNMELELCSEEYKRMKEIEEGNGIKILEHEEISVKIKEGR